MQKRSQEYWFEDASIQVGDYVHNENGYKYYKVVDYIRPYRGSRADSGSWFKVEVVDSASIPSGAKVHNFQWK